MNIIDGQGDSEMVRPFHRWEESVGPVDSPQVEMIIQLRALLSPLGDY